MTLIEICYMAARLTGRADEFVKTEVSSGVFAFTGYALQLFELMRDAVNTAYAEAAREKLMPDREVGGSVGQDGVIDVKQLAPEAYCVKRLTDAAGRELNFRYVNRFRLKTEARGSVKLTVCEVPSPLVNETDCPVFSEADVPAMLYAYYAAATVCASDGDREESEQWMRRYRSLFSGIRGTAGLRHRWRIPVFR